MFLYQISDIRNKFKLLYRNVLELNNAIDSFIDIECADIEVDNTNRFQTLMNSQEKLLKIKINSENVWMSQSEDIDEKLTSLYESYLDVRKDLSKDIDLLTLDLMISTDEVVNNEIKTIKDYSSTCTSNNKPKSYFFRKKKNIHNKQ